MKFQNITKIIHSHNSEEQINQLISENYNFNQVLRRNSNLKTTSWLQLSVRLKKHHIVKQLLSTHHIDTQLPENQESLIDAVCNHDYKMLKALINYGFDPNLIYKDKYCTINTQNTLLTYACLNSEETKSHEKILKLLLSHGANIEFKSQGHHIYRDGNTPLLLSSFMGDATTVNFLIENGANIHAKNAHKTTPLLASITGRRLSIINKYLELGFDVHQIDTKERNALFYSSHAGDVGLQILEILLKKGVNTNQINDEGNTPLMDYAFKTKNFELNVFNMFVYYGAKLSIKNIYGQTIADILKSKETLKSHKMAKHIQKYIEAERTKNNIQEVISHKIQCKKSTLYKTNKKF